MKLFSHFGILPLILVLGMFFVVSGQETLPNTVEILSNADIVLMSKSGLNKELIISKIKNSKGAFDVSAQGLVNLKNAGVDEDVIEEMLEKSRVLREKVAGSGTTQPISDNPVVIESVPTIIQNPADALRSAKTIAIEKSSLHPSRQALEKELLKRKDWQKLNLNIVRYKEGADLRVEIGRVPLSIVTHRYVFRIYDNRSGTVIAAGETTSWGSLAKNLAKHISTELNGVL